MLRSQVRRTLIKSPLELWEELSDPAALARHLGDFGEIRVTRAQEARALEWECETLSGTIELSPSGWGTRVTLTVSAPEDALPHPEPARAPAPEREIAAGEPTDGPIAIGKPEPGAAEHERERRERPAAGLFARLRGRFSRRRTTAGTTNLPDEPAADGSLEERGSVPIPFAPLTQNGLRPEIWLEEIEALDLRAEAREQPCEPAEDPAPPAVPAMTDVRAEAVLVAVLDRLGSAHHRPFSRS